MNKNADILQRRRAFVKDQVKRRSKEKVEIVIRQIAAALFLSEATIWQDLKAANQITT